MCGCFVVLLSGCALQEIRGKSKLGPEFRTKGAGGIKSHSTRWYVQQGVEFNWDNGIDTTVTYRRRDEDNGTGDHDNGVWFEISFPIWQAKEPPDSTARKIEKLEMRLAALEGEISLTAEI